MERFILRLAICLKDRAAGICYLVSAVVIVCLLLGLSEAGEERSAVPIGLVNRDDSRESEELAESIKKNSALYVYTGTEKELEDRLLDGYINSIFIIREDYGLNVRNGVTEELLEVISGEDDKVSVVVADIIAGSMLYDICRSKAYKMYKKQEGKAGKSREEYAEYVLATAQKPDFQFAFDLEYIDANNGKIAENAVTNGMIYKQMIAGMLAMLLSLISFASCNGICAEYENGARRRLKNLPCSKFLINLFDFFGIFVYTLPLGIISGLLLNGVKGMLLSIAYLAFMCPVCLLLSNLCKKTEAYQLSGAVVIIALGVFGFVSVFMGLIGGVGFAAYTPNALFISAFV